MCICVYGGVGVDVGGWIGVHESVGKGSGGCIGVCVGRVVEVGVYTHVHACVQLTGRISIDCVPKWAWYKWQ